MEPNPHAIPNPARATAYPGRVQNARFEPKGGETRLVFAALRSHVRLQPDKALTYVHNCNHDPLFYLLSSFVLLLGLLDLLPNTNFPALLLLAVAGRPLARACGLLAPGCRRAAFAATASGHSGDAIVPR